MVISQSYTFLNFRFFTSQHCEISESIIYQMCSCIFWCLHRVFHSFVHSRISPAPILTNSGLGTLKSCKSISALWKKKCPMKSEKGRKTDLEIRSKGELTFDLILFFNFTCSFACYTMTKIYLKVQGAFFIIFKTFSLSIVGLFFLQFQPLYALFSSFLFYFCWHPFSCRP